MSCLWFLYNRVCKVTAKTNLKEKLLETVLKYKHWPKCLEKIPKNYYKAKLFGSIDIFNWKRSNTITTSYWVTFPVKTSDSVAAILCNTYQEWPRHSIWIIMIFWKCKSFYGTYNSGFLPINNVEVLKYRSHNCIWCCFLSIRCGSR